MDITKKIIKINDNIGVRIFPTQLDFFDNEKTINLKGKDTENFRKYILPYLFKGVSEKNLFKIATYYDKKSFFSFIDELNHHGMLKVFMSGKHYSLGLKGNNFLLKSDEEIWRIVDCIIINPKEVAECKHSFFIVSSRYKVKRGKKNYYYWSTGADTVLSMAYLKSVFEAAERYYNSLERYHKITKASYSKVKDCSINPVDVIAYKNDQYLHNFTYKKFKESDIFQWVMANNYFSSEKKLIIVDEVYYPLDKAYLKRKKYTSANSSGSSAHLNKRDAIQNALYELIERDSFMIVWLNRLSMPKVNDASLPANVKERVSNLKAKGFYVSIFDITLDINPVFLAIIHSNKQGFAAFLGAGSEQNKAKAIDKALREAETLLFFAYKHNFVSVKKEDVKTPIDHGMYYRNIKNLKNINFLLKSEKTVSFKNKLDDRIWEKIKKESMKIYSVDLNRKSKDKSDISVVKVFVPSLVPITFGYKEEPLGMKRINEVPAKLGFNLKNKIDTREPHPFA